MYCEFCGEFFESKKYGGHKTNCKARSLEYKAALFEHRSKASTGRKLSQETKDKISKARIQYLSEHPEKVPYVLNHRYKETYPEKYFKEILPNLISQYRIPNTLYYADFANPSEKYIIEIDGEQHYVDKNIIEHDIKRTNILEKLGWAIIRIRWATFCKLSRLEKESIVQSLNKHSVIDMSIYEKHSNTCINCGRDITNRAIRCKSCSAIFHNKLKFIVRKDDLIELIKHNTMVKIGKIFNVSSNAIIKRCIKFRIDYKHITKIKD